MKDYYRYVEPLNLDAARERPRARYFISTCAPQCPVRHITGPPTVSLKI